MSAYLTVPLNHTHRREDFNCGVELLDNYLRNQAGQDVKRRLAVCFILADKEKKVQGYYTLSNAGIPSEYVPLEVREKLPRSYNELPVTLLGRLAIDRKSMGKGLGELLLLDALKRSYEVAVSSIGSMAIIVDPIDKDAIKFYKKYSFILLPDSGKMFLPMNTIAKLFEK